MLKRLSRQRKERYRLKHQEGDNTFLLGKGYVSLWIDKSAVAKWYYKGPLQKGAQFYYSDQCIECLMGFKAVFDLSYRQLEVFAHSVLPFMGINIEIPSYSQINRRAKELALDTPCRMREKTRQIVFDHKGLKLYGKKSWGEKKQDYEEKGNWLKLHLGLGRKKRMIYYKLLAKKERNNALHLIPMLEQIQKNVGPRDVDYDQEKYWDVLEKWGIQGLVLFREYVVCWTNQEASKTKAQNKKKLRLKKRKK